MAPHGIDRHDAVALLAVLGGGIVLAGEWLLVSHDAECYASLGMPSVAAYTIAVIPQAVVLALLALMVRCLFTNTDSDTSLKLYSTLTGAVATASAVLPELTSYHQWADTDNLLSPLIWILATLAVQAISATLMFLIAWLLDAETINIDR